MIHFILLVSRQGKTRLSKWYSAFNAKEKGRIIRETTNLVLSRNAKLCNFVEWKKYKIVYRRYASLYFLVGCDLEDNELIMLEVIHHFVEVLDRYFGNVCELDLIFNFHKAYFILDEVIMAGELQETSKKTIIRIMGNQDALQVSPEAKGKDTNF
uniref:AP complex subunit sigma n=1 Tax=Arcella intermedia TaxID=1963864 RepID=A0A6B2LNX6_9EUKA|eukprot:TRINITY_DN23511_c0_g1_i1.p1 TRINITY_DN23511_c0_g1~~TRINITY_DN23511_c0_g1_i1.p1  ORF type:complete len:155 (+),score=24.07 TRINITY_DN23511_c0_g1_i1:96-560(+)